MAYELREGQGSLFRNERRDSDKHPHARGEALIDGVLYEVAAWTKEGKKGKFQSLSFKRKDARPEPRREPQRSSYDRDDPRTGYGQADEDMDLPF